MVKTKNFIIKQQLFLTLLSCIHYCDIRYKYTTLNTFGSELLLILQQFIDVLFLTKTIESNEKHERTHTLMTLSILRNLNSEK